MKLQILCLHGYRQSAKTFKEKLGALRKLLKNECEFHFLDAPNSVEDSDSERSWWFSNDDSTYSSKHESNVCIGFEDSIEKIKTFCSLNGPFDGLLGFSQGAAFAAILCALKINELKFSFVILVAGFKSLIVSHSCFYKDTISLPSLHIIGKSDSVINHERSEELRNCFQDSLCETIYHEGGHYVPANKQTKDCYKSFILEHANPKKSKLSK